MDRILRLGSGGIPGVGQVSYNLWSKSLNLVVSAVDNRTLKRSIACQTNRLMLRLRAVSLLLENPLARDSCSATFPRGFSSKRETARSLTDAEKCTGNVRQLLL